MRIDTTMGYPATNLMADIQAILPAGFTCHITIRSNANLYRLKFKGDDKWTIVEPDSVEMRTLGHAAAVSNAMCRAAEARLAGV